MFGPHIDSDASPPEWMGFYTFPGRRLLQAAEATEYRCHKTGLALPQDLLETLATQGRGPSYEYDPHPGDRWYCKDLLDAWFTYCFRPNSHHVQPRFIAARFRPKNPVHVLLATTCSELESDLRENLLSWSCNVVQARNTLIAGTMSEIEIAFVEQGANLHAAIVPCEILKTRNATIVPMFLMDIDVPAVIERAGPVLRRPTMHDVQFALMKHAPRAVLERIRLSAVVTD